MRNKAMLLLAGVAFLFYAIHRTGAEAIAAAIVKMGCSLPQFHGGMQEMGWDDTPPY